MLTDGCEPITADRVIVGICVVLQIDAVAVGRERREEWGDVVPSASPETRTTAREDQSQLHAHRR